MAFLKNSFLTNFFVMGALLSGSVSGAPLSSQMVSEEQSTTWKAFTSTKSGFNIDLPSQPEHIEQSIDIPQTDLSITYNTYLCEPNDSVVYVISVWDYPKEIDMSDPVQNLQDGFAGMLSALPSSEVEFMEMDKTQGFDSLEFLVSSEDIFFRGKLILVHHTLFQVFTVYREGEEMDRNYSRFIKSLKFTNPQLHKESSAEKVKI
jgi:hypothetical protein